MGSRAVVARSLRSLGAAKRFFRRLLKGLRYGPTAIVTDKLSSYAAAREEVMPWGRTPKGRTTEQSSRELASTYLGAGATNGGFKSIRHAQRLLSVHGQVSNHFRPCRHRLRACHYREIMHRRFEDWRSITQVHPSLGATSICRVARDVLVGAH